MSFEPLNVSGSGNGSAFRVDTLSIQSGVPEEAVLSGDMTAFCRSFIAFRNGRYCEGYGSI